MTTFLDKLEKDLEPFRGLSTHAKFTINCA